MIDRVYAVVYCSFPDHTYELLSADILKIIEYYDNLPYYFSQKDMYMEVWEDGKCRDVFKNTEELKKWIEYLDQDD